MHSFTALVSLVILWAMQNNKKDNIVKGLEQQNELVPVVWVCIFKYTDSALCWNEHTFGGSHNCDTASALSTRLITVGLSTWGLLIFISIQGSHFKETFMAEVEAIVSFNFQGCLYLPEIFDFSTLILAGVQPEWEEEISYACCHSVTCKVSDCFKVSWPLIVWEDDCSLFKHLGCRPESECVKQKGETAVCWKRKGKTLASMASEPLLWSCFCVPVTTPPTLNSVIS